MSCERGSGRRWAGFDWVFEPRRDGGTGRRRDLGLKCPSRFTQNSSCARELHSQGVAAGLCSPWQGGTTWTKLSWCLWASLAQASSLWELVHTKVAGMQPDGRRLTQQLLQHGQHGQSGSRGVQEWRRGQGGAPDFPQRSGAPTAVALPPPHRPPPAPASPTPTAAPHNPVQASRLFPASSRSRAGW